MSISYRKRIIPVLLIHNGGLYKTAKFKNPKYIGDPINAVRIFNEKEVDELIILDIDASRKLSKPQNRIIEEITSEAFMPVAYGGGIQDLNDVERLFYNGIEKVILNTILFEKPEIITEIGKRYGNQSVVASVDFKKNFLGKKQVYSYSNRKVKQKDLIEFVKFLENLGVGEIMLNSVDNDGTYSGYDLDILKIVSNAVKIPVIICGGARNLEDFKLAEQNGASAMAAGSMFVFQRPHQAVLISYI